MKSTKSFLKKSKLLEPARNIKLKTAAYHQIVIIKMTGILSELNFSLQLLYFVIEKQYNYFCILLVISIEEENFEIRCHFSKL